jgi:uncharacterized protein
MLRVNLTDLDRAGTLRVQPSIAADDPLWSESGLDLAGPVELDLELSATPTGQILVRGTMKAPLRHQCRRCLAEVERVLHEELTLVWAPPDELDEERDEDAEIRRLELSQNELDLGEAIREELLLAAPSYVLCREDCRGLCPRCGVNRNEESCDCVVVEPDPRWDALRQLEDEQGN